MLADEGAGETDEGGAGEIELHGEVAQGGFADVEGDLAFDLDGLGAGEGVGGDAGIEDGLASLQAEAEGVTAQGKPGELAFDGGDAGVALFQAVGAGDGDAPSGVVVEGDVASELFGVGDLEI